jgi:hypothetical protein
MDELAMKKQEIEAKAQLEMIKMGQKQQLDGTKLGVEIAKSRREMMKKTKE